MKFKTLGLTAGFVAMLGSSPSLAQEPAPAPAPEPAPAPAAPPAPPPTTQSPAPLPPAVSFGAQVAPSADTGTAGPAPGAKPKKKKLPWRGTTFSWDQSATTETVGIGQDVQSVNPTYDWTFALKPRYIVWEDDDQNVSIRGDIGLSREFTNSDGTTERGEWLLNDIGLGAAYGRTLYENGDYKTDAALRAPTLTFPTSKSSRANGKVLGLGASIGATQEFPLAGSKATWFPGAAVNASIGYSHTFTQFTTPVDTDLDRIRMDIDGHSVPTDQLSGAAFPNHQLSLGFGTDLTITDRLSWGNSFGWKPTWKYKFDTENNDQLCGVVATGCAPIDRQPDRSNFVVVTSFASELGFKVIDEMSLAAGYNNVALQLGPDGQRRNIFYSPEARVFLTVTANLDAIYKTITGYDEQEKASNSQKRARVAKRNLSPVTE